MSDSDGDDAARALAVLDRLLREPDTYSVELSVREDGILVDVWRRQADGYRYGQGPTPAAALLALGDTLGDPQ